jgi:hypothetical protein
MYIAHKQKNDITMLQWLSALPINKIALLLFWQVWYIYISALNTGALSVSLWPQSFIWTRGFCCSFAAAHKGKQSNHCPEKTSINDDTVTCPCSSKVNAMQISALSEPLSFDFQTGAARGPEDAAFVRTSMLSGGLRWRGVKKARHMPNENGMDWVLVSGEER